MARGRRGCGKARLAAAEDGREALASEQVVARRFDSEFDEMQLKAGEDECADATEDFKQVERVAKASTLRSRRYDRTLRRP
jgi:hypothetical protein